MFLLIKILVSILIVSVESQNLIREKLNDQINFSCLNQFNLCQSQYSGCGLVSTHQQQCCQLYRSKSLSCFGKFECDGGSGVVGCFCQIVNEVYKCSLNQCTFDEFIEILDPYWHYCLGTKINPIKNDVVCLFNKNFKQDNCDKQPPLSSNICKTYACGGSSGLHYYSCCYRDERTFQSASDSDYCNPNNNYYTDSCGLDTFTCSEPIRSNCHTECLNGVWRQFPGFCWQYSNCFSVCCNTNGAILTHKVTLMNHLNLKSYSVYINNNEYKSLNVSNSLMVKISDGTIYYQVLNSNQPEIVNSTVTNQTYNPNLIIGLHESSGTIKSLNIYLSMLLFITFYFIEN